LYRLRAEGREREQLDGAHSIATTLRGRPRLLVAGVGALGVVTARMGALLPESEQLGLGAPVTDLALAQ